MWPHWKHCAHASGLKSPTFMQMQDSPQCTKTPHSCKCTHASTLKAQLINVRALKLLCLWKCAIHATLTWAHNTTYSPAKAKLIQVNPEHCYFKVACTQISTQTNNHLCKTFFAIFQAQDMKTTLPNQQQVIVLVIKNKNKSSSFLTI